MASSDSDNDSLYIKGFFRLATGSDEEPPAVTEESNIADAEGAVNANPTPADPDSGWDGSGHPPSPEVILSSERREFDQHIRDFHAEQKDNEEANLRSIVEARHTELLQLQQDVLRGQGDTKLRAWPYENRMQLLQFPAVFNEYYDNEACVWYSLRSARAQIRATIQGGEIHDNAIFRKMDALNDWFDIR